MDRNARASGGNLATADNGRASPVVLRLLAAVHHPPASVLVPGGGPEAGALDARGYRVAVDDDFLAHDHAGAFDLVCERGLFATLSGPDRDRYVASAARALRPGGRLFGVFWEGAGRSGDRVGAHPSELIHRFAPAFEVDRLEPSAFAGDGVLSPLEVVLVRR